MSSQIVFLFDLDQCLPLECGLKSEDLEFLIAKFKDVCLKILCSASCIDGPLGLQQNLSHFSFRFYSSTEFFMVPDQHQGKFYELGEDAFDLLDNALSERFEALLQTSKTNNFEAAALEQHMKSIGHKSHYQTLYKALEEIAVLYNWDRPLMHSPVKKRGKNSTENAIYIITKLPNDHEELNMFMGKPKSKRTFNHKDVFDRVFNLPNKTMINTFRGDANISVNVIDTASLRQKIGTSTKIGESFIPVKNVFKKCLFNFHGNVISIDAFRSQSCQKGHRNPVAVSSMMAAYADQYEKQSRPRKIVLEIGENQLQMNMVVEGTLASDEMTFITQGFVEKSKVLLSTRTDVKMILWPDRNSPWPASISHFLNDKNHVMVLQEKSTKITGLLHATADDSVFVLDVMTEEMSEICQLLMLGSWIDVPKTTMDSEFEPFLANAKPAVPKGLKNRSDKKCKNIKEFFRGNVFEPSCVPESKHFTSFTGQLKMKKRSESDSLLALKRAYLPHQKLPTAQAGDKCLTMRRKTSEESITSARSNNCTNNKKGSSRAAELLRLGSKNAEMRRNSYDDNNTNNSKIVNQTLTTGMEETKNQWYAKFEAQLEDVKDMLDSEPILKKLTKLQLDMLLDHGEHMALVSLAEITVVTLLKFVKASKKLKTSLEDMMAEYFLVNPDTVTKRKGNKTVRIRDHKLQVLYRVEVHWLLASQERQTKLEDEILVHLRQISIWDTPNEMLTFLQEVITLIYINRQPELLCLIYEELNQPPPPGLSALFSPFKKSDSSSPGPSSMQSHNSVESYMSNPSWLGHLPGGATLGNSQKQVDLRAKRVRRPQTFANTTLQIDLRDKKSKGKGIAQAKNTKAEPKKKTPRRQKGKKTPVKAALGARRNLTFDDGNTRKSPRKRLLQNTPKKWDKTPKKTKSHTPCKMTPGKKHQIFVPETPTAKSGARRKSDGTHTVNESPDIDKLKQAKTTPRRMNASLSLRRKTSFYSGDVSRNLLAAEENMNAKQLQNFSNTSLPLRLNSAGDDERTSSVLFPYLAARQRRQSVSQTEGKTPKKSEATPKKKTPNTAGRSMRRLFEDTDDTEIILKSPFKAKIPQYRSPRKRLPSSSSSSVFTSPRKGILKSPGYQNSNVLKPLDELLKSPSAVKKTPTREQAFDILVGNRNATPHREEVEENDELLTTPPSKTYTRKSPKSKTIDETPEKEIIKTTNKPVEISTPDSARPSRRRNPTSRMGIDDVLMSQVGSPKVKITPFSKHKHHLEKKDEGSPLAKDPTPKQTRKRISSSKKKLNLNEIWVKYPEDNKDNMIKDAIRKRKRTISYEESIVKAPEEDLEESFSPPGKFNFAIKAVESPNGAFKLHINRTKKPLQPFQRISRRTSFEFGMSPGKLLKLQTKSPSPVKKVRQSLDKENNHAARDKNTPTKLLQMNKYSPLSSTSLHNLTTSPILNCDLPKEGRRPSNDSPARKRRRVSKKLYDN